MFSILIGYLLKCTYIAWLFSPVLITETTAPAALVGTGNSTERIACMKREREVGK